MAVDEALLEAVAAEESPPVVRLYGFAPAAVSVGRFQPAKGTVDVDAVVSDGRDFVRRPSGGAAVLHAEELTYAVAVPDSYLARSSKRRVYRHILPFLLDGLRRLGLTDVRAVDALRGHRHNPDCFASASEYEIVVNGGSKIVGSAQLVVRGGVLQHGSVPLGPTYRDIRRYLCGFDEDPGRPSLSISEALGEVVTFGTAVRAYTEAATAVFRATRGHLAGAVRARAEELCEGKYTESSWNLGR
jgi:lipoate-protein ligase A